MSPHWTTRGNTHTNHYNDCGGGGRANDVSGGGGADVGGGCKSGDVGCDEGGGGGTWRQWSCVTL